MPKHDKKTVHAGVEPLKEEAFRKREELKEIEDDCRCKESIDKTVPQILKLMAKDLAFWKKTSR